MGHPLGTGDGPCHRGARRGRVDQRGSGGVQPGAIPERARPCSVSPLLLLRQCLRDQLNPAGWQANAARASSVACGQHALWDSTLFGTARSLASPPVRFTRRVSRPDRPMGVVDDGSPFPALTALTLCVCMACATPFPLHVPTAPTPPRPLPVRPSLRLTVPQATVPTPPPDRP